MKPPTVTPSAVASPASTAVPPLSAPLLSSFWIVTLPALATVVSAIEMSLPVTLVSTTAVPASFSEAVTPVLDAWSLMAATADDNPSPVVPDTAKVTACGVALSDCRFRL